MRCEITYPLIWLEFNAIIKRFADTAYEIGHYLNLAAWLEYFKHRKSIFSINITCSLNQMQTFMNWKKLQVWSVKWMSFFAWVTIRYGASISMSNLHALTRGLPYKMRSPNIYKAAVLHVYSSIDESYVIQYSQDIDVHWCLKRPFHQPIYHPAAAARVCSNVSNEYYSRILLYLVYMATANLRLRCY